MGTPYLKMSGEATRVGLSITFNLSSRNFHHKAKAGNKYSEVHQEVHVAFGRVISPIVVLCDASGTDGRGARHHTIVPSTGTKVMSKVDYRF